MAITLFCTVYVLVLPSLTFDLASNNKVYYLLPFCGAEECTGIAVWPECFPAADLKIMKVNTVNKIKRFEMKLGRDEVIP